MPYKLLMTHRVKPGHDDEVIKWFSDADKSRKTNNPAYQRPKRYVAVFGKTQEVLSQKLKWMKSRPAVVGYKVMLATWSTLIV